MGLLLNRSRKLARASVTLIMLSNRKVWNRVKVLSTSCGIRHRLSLLFNRELKSELYFQNTEKLHLIQQGLAREKWYRALLQSQQSGRNRNIAIASGHRAITAEHTRYEQRSSLFQFQEERNNRPFCWPFCLRTQNNINYIILGIAGKRGCLAMAVVMLEWKPSGTNDSPGCLRDSEYHFLGGC